MKTKFLPGEPFDPHFAQWHETDECPAFCFRRRNNITLEVVDEEGRIALYNDEHGVTELGYAEAHLQMKEKING